jgi:hypothetical protein
MKPKKLKLKKETIADLSRFEQMEVRAGAFTPETVASLVSCVQNCTGDTCTVYNCTDHPNCDTFWSCKGIPVIC